MFASRNEIASMPNVDDSYCCCCCCYSCCHFWGTIFVEFQIKIVCFVAWLCILLESNKSLAYNHFIYQNFVFLDNRSLFFYRHSLVALGVFDSFRSLPQWVFDLVLEQKKKTTWLHKLHKKGFNFHFIHERHLEVQQTGNDKIWNQSQVIINCIFKRVIFEGVLSVSVRSMVLTAVMLSKLHFDSISKGYILYIFEW